MAYREYGFILCISWYIFALFSNDRHKWVVKTLLNEDTFFVSSQNDFLGPDAVKFQ